MPGKHERHFIIGRAKKTSRTPRKGGGDMSKRETTRPKTDRKIYTNTAKKIKKINVAPKISRGGIRM